MRSSMVALVALAAAAVFGPVRAADPPFAAPDACAPQVPKSWRCLVLSVPEDYSAPNGRKAVVHIVIAPAVRPKAKPEALFYLQGGPGGGGTVVAGRGFVDSMLPMQKDHDLVVVDQRGVSGADMLDCPPVGPAESIASYSDDLLAPAHVKACLERSRSRVRLSTLTTTTFAHDLETVRTAFGYDRVEIYAADYGARIAQEYMRRFPGRTRAAVLADASPMDEDALWADAPNTERAIGAVLDACERDDACHAAYPAIRSEYADLKAKLERRAVSMTAVENGSVATFAPPQSVVLPFFASHFHFMRAVALIPWEIHALDSGDPARTAAVLGDVLAFQKSRHRDFALGQWLSVECAEDAPDLHRRLARGEASADVAARLRFIDAACSEWPHGSPPADFHDPVATSTPVLLLGSPMEVYAPASFAPKVMARFRNAKLVVAANHGHVWDDDWKACLGPQSVAFLESADLSAVDPSCAARFTFRPFKIPD